MPIHCPVQIKPLAAAAFETLDYRVMGHAYASQNELGRLCDECAYQAELKARLLADGFRSVFTETPVTVTHRDFTKKYYLDLIAGDALYEWKADAALVGEHETQLFNYMFLLGLPRGKLLNFRPLKVTPKVLCNPLQLSNPLSCEVVARRAWGIHGEIIATSLTQAERHRFTAFAEHWNDLTPECGVLRQTMRDLLQDWGAFLDFALYQEALVHFLGGASNVERQVSLSRGGNWRWAGSVCLSTRLASRSASRPTPKARAISNLTCAGCWR